MRSCASSVSPPLTVERSPPASCRGARPTFGRARTFAASGSRPGPAEALPRHQQDRPPKGRDELSDFGDRHANRASADIVVPGADYELPGLWVPSRPEVQTVPSSVLDEQATPGCELRHGHSMNPPDSDVESASDTERVPPASRSAQNAVTRNGRSGAEVSAQLRSSCARPACSTRPPERSICSPRTSCPSGAKAPIWRTLDSSVTAVLSRCSVH
jgi:hypothetical protein